MIYSKNIIIESFDPVSSPYKYFITHDKIYNTKIYSRIYSTNKKNIKNTVIRIPYLIKESYSIIDKDNKNYYTYVGSYNDLKMYLKYSPYIKLLFKNPKIIKNKNEKYNNYILNDSIFLSIQIWSSCHNKINKIVNLYLDFNIWIYSIFNIKLNSLIKFINKLSVDDNYNFLFSLVIFSINNLNNQNLLLLPGVDINVSKLLENKYQIQIFNKTKDINELYNLADSSRINEYIDVCNLFINKLNQNIKYNNLLNIYLSIPNGV